MEKCESMGKYGEVKELKGTRHHEILVIPSDLLFKDSSQNQLFGVDRSTILRDRPPDGPVVLA